MPRYKIIVEYLGTKYSGWQKQNNLNTIQAEIELALLKFCGHQIRVFGSGRTDAGVHAFGQAAHFDLLTNYPADVVFRALNFYLQNTGIAILNVTEVDESFDARFSAIRRNYLYKIINRSAPIAINQGLALFISRKLLIEKMQESCQYFIGRHDFSAFRSSECRAKSPIKTVSKCQILYNQDIIEIYVSADSFLQHMVRNIVGTLLMVGDGKIAPIHIQDILKSGSRKNAGPTAAAWGLYYLSVDY